jgi:hypothetical protein
MGVIHLLCELSWRVEGGRCARPLSGRGLMSALGVFE